MYDLRYLRENLDAVRAQLGPRGSDVAWDKLREKIEKRRNLIIEVEANRHEVKKFSEDIGRLKREKKGEEAENLHRAQGMSTLVPQIGKQEKELRSIEQEVDDLAYRIPNLPHASVPVGKDSSRDRKSVV